MEKRLPQDELTLPEVERLLAVPDATERKPLPQSTPKA